MADEWSACSDRVPGAMCESEATSPGLERSIIYFPREGKKSDNSVVFWQHFLVGDRHSFCTCHNDNKKDSFIYVFMFAGANIYFMKYTWAFCNSLSASPWVHNFW